MANFCEPRLTGPDTFNDESTTRVAYCLELKSMSRVSFILPMAILRPGCSPRFATNQQSTPAPTNGNPPARQHAVSPKAVLIITYR